MPIHRGRVEKQISMMARMFVNSGGDWSEMENFKVEMVVGSRTAILLE